MNRSLATVIAYAAMIGTALPGVLPWDPRVQGTWSTQAGCDWLNTKQDGHSWPRDFEQFAYLRQDGIEGYEWSCQFVRTDADGDDNIVATASCTSEGDGWPDVFLVQRDYRSGWRITTKGADGKAVVTVFPVRCDRR